MNKTPEKNQSSSQHTIKKFYYSGIFISFLGLLLSAYSLYHHFKVKALGGQTDAFCNINSAVNCDKVAASSYSEFYGIPLGVFGIGFFLSLAILYASGLLQKKAAKENIPASSICVYAGTFVSVVLAVISLTQIGSVCLVCIGIYVSCILLLTNDLVFRKKILAVYPFTLNLAGKGLVTAGVIVAATVAAFNFLGPKAELPSKLLDLPGRQTDFSKKPNLDSKVYDLAISRSEYAGLGEDYRTGNDQAKVTIVEFADYQCPGCATMAKVLQTLTNEFGPKIALIFKNYPLDIKCNSTMKNPMHPFACDIAKIARCAGRYGHFWEFHHLAFEKQEQASVENAKTWGKTAGLNNEQIEECLNSPDILAKIRDDISVANRAEVDGTPAIFINNKKYVGNRDYETMKRFIESML